MLRVAQGRARPDTEWSGRISALEFSSNPGGSAGIQVSTGGRSRSHCGLGGGLGMNTILTVSRSHLEHEIDLEAKNGAASDMNPVTGKENLDAALSMKAEAGVRENVVSTK
jgi:hypothetical protein